MSFILEPINSSQGFLSPVQSKNVNGSTGLTDQVTKVCLETFHSDQTLNLGNSDFLENKPQKTKKSQISPRHTLNDQSSSSQKSAKKRGLKEEETRIVVKEDFFVVREKSDELPAVHIDEHEWKHSENWPAAQRSGGKGSMFPETVTKEDIKEIGLGIVKATPGVFDSRPVIQKEKTPSKLKYSLIDVVPRSTTLYRKIKSSVSNISSHAGFDSREDTWGFHFYPDEAKQIKRQKNK